MKRSMPFLTPFILLLVPLLSSFSDPKKEEDPFKDMENWDWDSYEVFTHAEGTHFNCWNTGVFEKDHRNLGTILKENWEIQEDEFDLESFRAFNLNGGIVVFFTPGRNKATPISMIELTRILSEDPKNRKALEALLDDDDWVYVYRRFLWRGKQIYLLWGKSEQGYWEQCSAELEEQYRLEVFHALWATMNESKGNEVLDPLVIKESTIDKLAGYNQAWCISFLDEIEITTSKEGKHLFLHKGKNGTAEMNIGDFPKERFFSSDHEMEVTSKILDSDDYFIFFQDGEDDDVFGTHYVKEPCDCAKQYEEQAKGVEK